jgi:hypothetical protein
VITTIDPAVAWLLDEADVAHQMVTLNALRVGAGESG